MIRILHSYTQGIRTSIRYNAAAYGYSVLITASFGALSVQEGSPKLEELFLFVAGAASAFALIEAAASNLFRDRVRGERPEVVMLGSAFSLVSISGGLGAAALSAWLLDAWLPWLVSPFVGTMAYLLLLGVELALARAAERKLENAG